MVVCDICGGDYSSGYLTDHKLKMHPGEAEFKFECDFCEKGYRSKSGLNTHIQAVHPEEYDTTVECSNCGDEIERQPYQLEKYDRHFCDESCKGEYYTTLTGENAFNWRGGDVTLECNECGDEFDVTRYLKDSARFCSEECYGKAVPAKRTGEDHPRWKGGHKWYYGRNWPTQRQKRLEKDNYECQACGLAEEESKKKHGRSLDVHHIKPLASFKEGEDIDYELANEIENLITLCRTCHGKWEGIPVMPM